MILVRSSYILVDPSSGSGSGSGPGSGCWLICHPDPRPGLGPRVVSGPHLPASYSAQHQHQPRQPRHSPHHWPFTLELERSNESRPPNQPTNGSLRGCSHKKLSPVLEWPEVTIGIKSRCIHFLPKTIHTRCSRYQNKLYFIPHQKHLFLWKLLYTLKF